MTEPNKSLLLDFDGTLADSLPIMYEIYSRFVLNYNGHPSRCEFHSLNGPPTEEVILQLKKNHEIKTSTKELLSNYFDLRDQLKENILPARGSSTLLNTAKQLNLKIAIVTSSHSKDVQEWLEKYNLAQYIDVIIGSDKVKNGKPSPEPYLKAVSFLNSLPQLSVAIEDSPIGLISAQSANIKTLYIGESLNGEAPEEPIYIKSLFEAIEYL